MAVRGGDKMEQALEEIARKLGNGATLRTGFMEGATYPDGTSVPMVAAMNEFGAPSRGRPPRPFMRNMIAENSGQWPRLLAHWLKETDYDAVKALGAMGDILKGQMQESIITFSDPVEAPSTIKRKGFSAPLRDTRTMLEAVTSEVKEND